MCWSSAPGRLGWPAPSKRRKLGLKVIVLDKGCLVNSLFHYPAGMVFFTTPELLEIGDIPFTTAQQKPTREEALEYYRKVAEHYQLDVRQYEWVKTVMGEDGNFSITATDRAGRPHDYCTRKVIVSTGYYDLANQLGLPGEDLPKVSHYYARAASLLRHRRAGDRRQELRGDRGARSVASWRARHTGLSRRATAPPRQILDQARSREPDQERGDRSLLQQLGAGNWSGPRCHDHAARTHPPEERFRAGPDRLSSRLRLSAQHGHRAFGRAMPSGLRPGFVGKQRARNLRGGRDRRRIADQRNFHRERPLPRQADRRRPEDASYCLPRNRSARKVPHARLRAEA